MKSNHNPAYKELFHASLDAIVCSNETGLITLWNRAAEKMFGYSADEAVGQPLTMLMSPDDQHRHKAGFKRFINTGETRMSGNTIEVSAVGKNGLPFPVEFSLSSSKTEYSRIFTAILRDITERKRAEEKNAAHRRFLENTKQIDAVIRQATDVEQMMSDTLQVTLDMFETDRVWLLYPCDPDAASWNVPMERTRPEYPGAFALGEEVSMLLEKAEIIRQALEKDEVITFDSQDVVAPKETDERFSILSQIHMAVYPQSGKPWLFGMHQCSHHRDWTDNEKNLFQEIGRRLGDGLSSLLFQRDLQVSEKKYRGMVMNLMEGFYRVTLDGKLQDYNAKFTNILGLDPNKDHTGIALPIFWQNLEDRKAYAKEIKARGFIKNYMVHARKLDGEKIVLQINARLIKSEDGHPLLIEGSFLDITERKQAEALVHKLSNAVSHAGGSIMITDRGGIIEYVNPAFTKITGYAADEAIGQTPGILNSGNQNAAFYERMWHAIGSGNIWHGKVIDKRKDGSFFPAMLTIAPIADDKGVITHFIGSHADISALEDMELQFHQAQKMEAIGTLVGGIAHDFNNMLAGMTGNLYLAKKKVQEQPDVVQKLSNVEQLSLRAAEMIQQLLTFARKDRVSIKPLPFTPFIKETLKFLETSVPENICLHQNICNENLQINGDATQLHQVLMNLINNARDAVENVDDPRLTIRLAAFHADDGWLESHAYFKAGTYAHLSVTDNGCGIPEEQMEHLFEPFFTTKKQGKGTGLGLAMVFGAVKTHHGFVDVESLEGQGAVFHVYLPLLKSEDIEAAPSHNQEIAEQGHGEMILLVDDEACIVDPGAEVLNALGYQVLTARNGQQAVDIFSAHRGEIALIILDVVMPVMGGGKAAELIRQQRPDVKIVFSTGYDKSTQTELAGETVLGKPFSIVEMSQLIRQQLKE